MHRQYGVIAYRRDEAGALRILLITSRETRRWVVPRGNPISRLSPEGSAAQEAYEEAGVRGETSPVPLGSYRYLKQKKTGAVDTEVTLFPMRVDELLNEWPERGQRVRRWFSRVAAASAVHEAELADLIRGFDPAPVQARERANRPGADAARGFNMFGLFKAIMPKEDRFFDMFQRHAETMVGGADAMAAMFAGKEAIAASCERIANFENQADDVTRDVLVAVRRSFITPFDRSAITALISSMDDAVDEMWQTAKAITLYEVSSFEPQMCRMSELAADAARLVVEAIPLLRNIGRNAARLHEITEQIVHLEGQADDLHEAGLKGLFQAHGADRPMSFIVGREVYSHLERVLDRLEDVADEIQGIVIDHA